MTEGQMKVPQQATKTVDIPQVNQLYVISTFSRIYNGGDTDISHDMHTEIYSKLADAQARLREILIEAINEYTKMGAQINSLVFSQNSLEIDVSSGKNFVKYCKYIIVKPDIK